jgi:hypothetical protein
MVQHALGAVGRVSAAERYAVHIVQGYLVWQLAKPHKRAIGQPYFEPLLYGVRSNVKVGCGAHARRSYVSTFFFMCQLFISPAAISFGSAWRQA